MRVVLKRYQRNIIKILTGILILAGIAAAGRIWYLEEQGNFHAVTAGEAYRSAQLDPDELAYYIKKYHIRSIINLRGQNAGEDWYRKEAATSRRLHAVHYDLGLDAEAAPSPSDMAELLRIFRTAPRPVLMHCQAGADRSGLAAAIWKMVIDGASKSTAKKQLSIRFGHLPVGPTRALDVFLEHWTVPEKAGEAS